MVTQQQARLIPRPLKMRQAEAMAGYLCILPWIIGFVIFTLGPMVASFYFGLTRWDLIGSPRFVGLGNYTALAADRLFWQSLKVTAIYSLGRVSLGIIFGLAVAVLLNQKIKALSFWRVIYYLPVVLPPVAVSLLWLWIYNPRYGVLNLFLQQAFGIRGPAWLESETLVLPALITMAVWAMMGRYMIIYLSGLQSVAPELYEAADIDGARSGQKFFRITLPMLTPIIFFNLVMGLIESIKAFTQAYIMTDGGPRFASYFYVYYLYEQAFQRFRMGYASAMAWVFFLIILAMTLIVFKSSPLWVYYEGVEEGGS